MHWSSSRVGASGFWVATGFAFATPSCVGDVAIERPVRGDQDAGENTEAQSSLCQPGLVRCENSWVERCMASGTGAPPRWIRFEDCHSAELCVAPGMCVPPSCEAHAVRCVRSRPERCRADRIGWEDDPLGEACDRAEQCLDAGACPTCSIGSFACNDGTLSRCNDGLTFTSLERSADCVGLSRVSCDGDNVESRSCGALGCNAVRGACQDDLPCTGPGHCACVADAASCDGMAE